MNHYRADSHGQDRVGVWTVVVAGGSGLRFGERKQFVSIAGKTVLEHSVEQACESSEGVIAVVPSDAVESVAALLGPAVRTVAGGASRADSVRAGLAVVPSEARIVLVHDAARPLATGALYERVIAAIRDGSVGAIPAVELSDSIRTTTGEVVDRAQLRAVQTPQGFRAEVLRAAHAEGADATDDATLVSTLGHEIVLVEGEHENRKITHPVDLAMAESVIGERQTAEEHS